MPDTIEQTVRLPDAAESLYATYLDPNRHAAVTGSPVEISAEPGTVFRAFNGMLSGRMLHVVASKMIVQTWRSNHWDPDALDSVLTLRFADEKGIGRIELVHIGVAESDYEGVAKGWENFYWTPWREYLEQR